MRALVVYCHPVEGSFCSAMRDAAVRGLRSGGHHVDIVDLAADQFSPVMTEAEWQSYMEANAYISPELARYVELVREAELMVFVYPTWWSSAPAQLKGWLERVFIPTVAFNLNKRDKVRPALSHLRHIVTVTTFGSPWMYVKAINDNGSRILLRALRLMSSRRTKTTRLALYQMDTSTIETRSAFLHRIEAKLAQL